MIYIGKLVGKLYTMRKSLFHKVFLLFKLEFGETKCKDRERCVAVRHAKTRKLRNCVSGLDWVLRTDKNGKKVQFIRMKPGIRASREQNDGQ